MGYITHSDDWNAHQAQQLLAVFVVVAGNPNQAFGKPVDIVLVIRLSSDLQLRLSLGTLRCPLRQLLVRGIYVCMSMTDPKHTRQSSNVACRETRETLPNLLFCDSSSPNEEKE